jgi:hypothetical protein
MKRIIILLIMILANIPAYGSNMVIEQVSSEYENIQPMDEYATVADEYGHAVTRVDEMDEYDQDMSDTIQPPKISYAQALCADIVGSVLIRYIAIREKTRLCFNEFKNFVARCVAIVRQS